MTLEIRHYLALLREREELDSILPNLLSQMGLTVFSRPRRGTRQDGVDVGAAGRLDDDEEKVNLFSIKAGDLTRSSWDGTAQAMRASLNAIVSTYVRNRMPVEHRGKPIVICLCIGGDIREEVRPDLVSYFEATGLRESSSRRWWHVRRNRSPSISFQEWNGDKLAREIEKHLMREELLPPGARSNLRKALAIIDQPESSFGHFAALAASLVPQPNATPAATITSLRQLALCLRVIFTWGREAGNTEAAYRSGEFVLLHAWPMFKDFATLESKTAQAVGDAFLSIYSAYQEISGDFLRTNVILHARTPHGISTAIRGSCSLDVNLKLFDLLGRLAVAGLWATWTANRAAQEHEADSEILNREAGALRRVLLSMVNSNPALMLPSKEDQVVELGIAFLFLSMDEETHDDLRGLLREVFSRVAFSIKTHGPYPCTLRGYGELLEHPKRRDDEYRKEVTAGSVLLPLIATWAALLREHDLFDEVAALKRELLSHCCFQYWFPDEVTEEFLYSNAHLHGATLTDLDMDRSEEEFLQQLFSECDSSPHFTELSAVRLDFWPIVAVACRHHRLPLPLHFLRFLPSRLESALPASSAEVRS